MSTSPRNALVVGAGVVGTLSAFRLARSGWNVTVFDSTPGAGATWAAAGMIAPSAEIAPGERDNYHLQRGALLAWRGIADELATLTGDSLDVRESGTLLVGVDASDRLLVEQFQVVATSFGARTNVVSRDDDEDLFEGISPRIRGGLFVPGDGWLDPDHAMALLARANELLGVVTVPLDAVTASVDGPYVVVTADTSYRGDVGLLATGARALPTGVAQRASHSVRPVRGMTLRVVGLDRSDQPTVRAFVRGRPFYLVSRPGGYCVVGSTSDERSELFVEVGDLARLLRDALDVVPSLDGARVVETRQGLRPVSKDLRPFFEVIDERWAWSTGHYRHGVTLAPFAAEEALTFARGAP